MRVIAGQARGRRLRAPRGLTTRPALARLRQSIFSRLAARTDLEGARVLDLFAGSGSLGIEALSRGAAEVVFVDSSLPACAAISRNLADLEMTARGQVVTKDVDRAIGGLAARGRRFDLVLIDPPYRDAVIGGILARLLALDLLAEGAWIAARQPRRAAALAPIAGLELVSSSVMGDDRTTFYRRPSSLGSNQSVSQ